MSADLQSTFFEKGTGERVEIETDGRTIRPVARLLTPLVNEARVTVDEHGLSTTYVDPANVALGDIHVKPEAFDHYDATGEETVGLHVDDFQSLAANARMSTRTNDRVDLSIDSDRTLFTVEKEYAGTTVRKTDSLLNIDPDAIRQDPDLPDFDLPVQTTVDVPALADVIENLPSNHARIARDDGHLYITADGGDTDLGVSKSMADFGPVDGDDVESTFSLDYLTDIVRALKSAKIDDVQLTLGDHFPLSLAFEHTREDDDGAEQTIIEGEYAIAPRIKDGGE
jgi:proliferating cell nuclear antigen